MHLGGASRMTRGHSNFVVWLLVLVLLILFVVVESWVLLKAPMLMVQVLVPMLFLLGGLLDPLVKLMQKGIQLKDLLTFKTKSEGEDWATTLGWFIPRKYRHVIGDILEDCTEMREAGCTERRIKFHVVYQWLLAVITLVPASIIGILRQVISPPK